MRITVKGQLTIPQDVREALGLLPHTEVDFVVVGNEARLRKAKPTRRSRGAAIVEQLRGAGGPPAMTTDEILALMRGVP